MIWIILLLVLIISLVGIAIFDNTYNNIGLLISSIIAILTFALIFALVVGLAVVKRESYEEPVTAIINGEEVPIVSIEIHENYTIAVGEDGNEYLTTENVIVYEKR